MALHAAPSVESVLIGGENWLGLDASGSTISASSVSTGEIGSSSHSSDAIWGAAPNFVQSDQQLRPIEYKLDWDRIKGRKRYKFDDNKLVNLDAGVKKEEINLRDFGDIPGLLTTIYAPMIAKLIGGNLAFNMCTRAKAERLINIDSEQSARILEPVHALYKEGHRFVLAGGKLVSWLNKEESDNDFDLFFTSQKEYVRLYKRLRDDPEWTNNDKPHVNEFDHKDSGLSIQLIRKTYASPEHIISEFDFFHCALAYDGEMFYWVKGALHANRDKNIRFQNLTIRRTQFVRMQKFLLRGFNVSPAEWALASVGYLMTLRNTPGIHDFIVDREQYDHSKYLAELDECYNDWLED